MYLTEEQKQSREEMFIEFMCYMAEQFDYVEPTEESEEIAAIMMEYFVENYKQPNLQESAIESMSGVDLNEDLINEYVDMLIEWSIGGVLAGAAHGVKNLVGKAKSAVASHQLKSANKAATTASGNLAKQVTKNNVASSKPAPTGVFGKVASRFKQAYAGGKTTTLANKSASAETSANAARVKSIAAGAAKGRNTQQTKKLAKKIDTGITKVKSNITSGVNRLKNAASNFANKSVEKVGGAVGSLAGRVA